MQPQDIEQHLYDHAIRTKIRPQMKERLRNLIEGRPGSTFLIFSAALSCTIVGSGRDLSPGYDNGNGHIQITDTDPYKQHLNQANHALPEIFPPASATLAMSR